jgi:hypothetical protein
MQGFFAGIKGAFVWLGVDQLFVELVAAAIALYGLYVFCRWRQKQRMVRAVEEYCKQAAEGRQKK